MFSLLGGLLQFDADLLGVVDQQLFKISTLLKGAQQEFARKVCDLGFEFTNPGGLTLYSTVRLAIYKVLHKQTYRELERSTRTDIGLRMFAALGGVCRVPRATLQEAITELPVDLMEALNHILIRTFDDISEVQIDSTSIEANVALPENNALLYNGVKRCARIVKAIEDIVGTKVFSATFQASQAKLLSYDIRFAKHNSDEKKEKYKKLLFIAGDAMDAIQLTVEEGFDAIERISKACKAKYATKLLHELEFMGEKLSCVIYQTIAWMQCEKLVPDDKLLSMAGNMEHVDIITKGNRKTIFGHKGDIITSKKGLIAHVIIHKGNPADSKTYPKILLALVELFGTTPKTVITDGGYCSTENASFAHDLGVEETAFSRKRQLSFSDLGMNEERFNVLKRARSGIERVIGRLKQSFGFSRVICTGFKRFTQYLWIGVVTANLATIASNPKLFQQ